MHRPVTSQYRCGGVCEVGFPSPQVAAIGGLQRRDRRQPEARREQP